jgi:peptide/nickel transport system substrate-binding protein
MARVDGHRLRRRLARLGTLGASIGLAFPALIPAAGAFTGARAAAGGSITFGLEAETTDYCLPRAQLAISGIQVAAAIYDTLTVPNDRGQIVPYLAKAVTPSPDFTTWTIALRPGVKFHDGTALDAAALKLNLDSYRGAPGAPNSGPLLTIYFKFIQDVEVVDPLTVRVGLSTPVADFPAYLYNSGRIGIAAPAQLNSGDACATKLIGTGPFVLEDYKQNEHTIVKRNPNYWQKGYPKVDKITFVPLPEGAARVTQLQGGQLDITHTDSALQIDALRGLGSRVKRLTQPPGLREIHYYFLLTGSAPFRDAAARVAFATALDRRRLDQIRANGIFEVANSIMDRNAPGYLKDAGYPRYSLTKAKQLVSQYKAAHGGSFHIVLGTGTDPESSAEMQEVKQELGNAGITADIAQFDQATLINKALSGDINVLDWRNLHGSIATHSDESNYIWFANYNSGNLVNFGHFTDPTTQSLLDAGRSLTDPNQINKNYQDFNKAMAKQVYLLPIWYVNWTIGYQPSVNLAFPPLPDGNGKPLFVYGRIPVLGLTKG